LLDELDELSNFVFLAGDLLSHTSLILLVISALLAFVLHSQLKSFQLQAELLEFAWVLGSDGVGISLGLSILELFILELLLAFLDKCLVLGDFGLDVSDVLGNDVFLVSKSLGGSGAVDSSLLGLLGDLDDGACNISDT
jgi:hypothetical protein